jgi:hypothetical protein
MTDDTAALLAERGSTHGEFTEHARATQGMMRVLMAERRWEVLSDIQREALHMLAHKMGRIVTGNPDHLDHWDDICGYARLVSDRLRRPDLYVQFVRAAGGIPPGCPASGYTIKPGMKVTGISDKPHVIVSVADMPLEDIQAEITDPPPLPEDPTIMELAAVWKTTPTAARLRLSVICHGAVGRLPRYPDQALQWLGAHWRADRADTLRQLKEMRSGTEDSRPSTSEPKVESPRPSTINRGLEDGLRAEKYFEMHALLTPSDPARPTLGIIERRAYADEDVAHLPRLPRELNATEHEETPREYRWLYDWSEDAGGKWVLRDEYVERWGREA